MKLSSVCSTITKLRVLEYIAEFSPVTPTEIASMLGTQYTRTYEIIKEFEESGYITVRKSGRITIVMMNLANSKAQVIMEIFERMDSM